MTAVAAGFSRKGAGAIVTLAAELACINGIHFNIYRTKLHFWKSFRVVTLRAFHPGVPMNFP